MRNKTRKIAVLFLLLLLFVPSVAVAQWEWIDRVDRDRNGYVEPDEISDRARDYLERFTKDYGISLARPNAVKRLEEAAKLYYASRERRDRDRRSVAVPRENKMKPFGVDDDKSVVPAFGISEVRYEIKAADLEEAEQSLRRNDRNDDGRLDEAEIMRGSWDKKDPHDFDFNRDGYLSKLELSQRYARRRILSERQVMSLGGESEMQREESRDSDRDREESRRTAGSSRNGDRGSASLAASIVERYDFNRNNQLDADEMELVGIRISLVDFDRSGGVNSDEFARYIASHADDEADKLRDVVPTWFFEKDLNNDRQIHMSEFAEVWEATTLEEFQAFDINDDGFLTAEEVLSARVVSGGKFRSQKAHVLLPRATIVSEIEVDEDYTIGDLNLRLSITHTYVDYLDAYLIGPEGQRVELFTSVGGSDDHFDRTLFDDDAEARITRSRPPFRGSFRPEALDRRKPGLNQFRGKNLKGIWQLMIRASRSDRTGILHGWSLEVSPSQESVDNLASEEIGVEAEEETETVKVGTSPE